MPTILLAAPAEFFLLQLLTDGFPGPFLAVCLHVDLAGVGALAM